MTSAAAIVAMQAEMMAAFREPDPRVRGAAIEVTTGSGDIFTVPISRIGRAVDHAMFGDELLDPGLLRALNPGRHSTTLDTAKTVAPLVAQGVSRGRAYKVQENMTAPIVQRADGYSQMTFFDIREADDGAGIMPPTSSGWAFFEEPVPVLVEPFDGRDDPTISLITWNTVVQPEGREWGTPLLWLVVAWEDVLHSGIGAADYGTRSMRVVPGQRFAPMNAYLITPGEALEGTPIEPQAPRKPEYAHLRVRNLTHIIAALWEMLGETVPGAGVEREETDRRTQRRARIEGVVENTSSVTTVVLRREHRPVLHPGSGNPHTSRVLIEERMAWRWIGSEKRGDRRRVRRTVREHWSCNNPDLPVRERKVVSELRR